MRCVGRGSLCKYIAGSLRITSHALGCSANLLCTGTYIYVRVGHYTAGCDTGGGGLSSPLKKVPLPKNHVQFARDECTIAITRINFYAVMHGTVRVVTWFKTRVECSGLSRENGSNVSLSP